MTDTSSHPPRYDHFTPTSERASKALSRTRRKDTKCEVALRRELWHRGFRYRKHYADVPGTPDIPYLPVKLAIFCDGDLWHGRNWNERRHKLDNGSNPGYWIPKIERDRARDREVNEVLKARGWTVLRFWETDILKDPSRIAGEIIDALKDRRSP